MIELLEIAKGAIELGFIYSLVVMAVFFTSRILHFDDLTVEGSFATGGAIVAKCLISGLNVGVSLLFAIIGGGIVGLMTGLLHTKLKINNLISGLIVTTAMFSINLKTAGATISLASTSNIFKLFVGPLEESSCLLVLFPLSFFFLFAIKWLLNTEIGSMLQVVGSNPQMLTNLGRNIKFYKSLGLVMSNSLTALAGGLFVQYTGFFSITGSIGTLIIALAGLMLGEIISKKIGVGLVIGAILYQAIFAMTIELQWDPVWNKLVTAVIMVLLLLLKSNKTSTRFSGEKIKEIK